MLTDLATAPISETLRKLSVERRSGDLQVQSGRVVKTIFFDHGRIVFAASNLKKDRLGEALVAIGRITDEQFNQVSALLKSEEGRKKRFGDALVQAGVLDKNEMGRSVARQVDRIVLSVFEFADGVAAFEERNSAIPLEYMVSLSIHRLLYDGIRLMKSQDLVMSALGGLDRRVSLAAVTPFAFDMKQCPADERDILEQARRKVTLRRLAWQPGGLSFPRLRACYALLAAGVLLDEAEKVDAEAQPVVNMETGTFLLSTLRRQPDPSAQKALRQELTEELERSAHLDREGWLRVSREAPREELIKALEDKMERYHAMLEAAGDDDQLKIDIEVILGRASAMLRLARQAPAPPPPPVPAAAPAQAAAPAPSADARPADGSMAGMAQVEHLLLEGEVRMTVSDYANAVKVYEKLVNLAPNVAQYRVRLAIAMAGYPRTAKMAEREFLDALRLEPNNADIHYQFGLYYKVMKQRARALAEMQTAVKLNHRHRLARAELETLSPKDSALVNLKKLFK
jgi:tetratricopeptide (TPR) repeat protein